MKTSRTQSPTVLSRIEKRLALFAVLFGVPVLATPGSSASPSRRRRK